MAYRYKRKVIDGKRWLLHRYMAFVTLGLEEKCSCGSEYRVFVHHKDGDGGNNSKENLEVMCQSCHSSLHHKNKTISVETREKMSISRKKFYQNKNTLAKNASRI